MAELITAVETAEEAISIEDLRALLAAKGLDIKALAKEAQELKMEKKVEEVAPVKKATTADPVFELALANYPDFVIRRSTAKTERLLVIMPSQDSYYIKTVKDGKEEKKALDRKSYSAFTSGMPDIALPEDFWMDEVVAGVDHYDWMTRLLRDEPFRKAIVGRYFIKRNASAYAWNDERDMYEQIPNVLKAFPGKDLRPDWRGIKHILDKFGLENARDFVKEREVSLLSGGLRIPTGYLRENGMLEKYDFKYSSFKEYVLYDSVRMGYGDDSYHFFSTWEDTLGMQIRVYGKIKEKYPEHLAELHNQLAYKCRIMKQEIDERLFAERAEKASRLEARIGDYVFIAPKKPQDFYDEATAQANCLASYVGRYADGEDYIIFMRKADAPEASLVTIELDLDGGLRQAYQERNRRVTASQQEVIDRWLETTVRKELEAAA